MMMRKGPGGKGSRKPLPKSKAFLLKYIAWRRGQDKAIVFGIKWTSSRWCFELGNMLIQLKLPVVRHIFLKYKKSPILFFFYKITPHKLLSKINTMINTVCGTSMPAENCTDMDKHKYKKHNYFVFVDNFRKFMKLVVLIIHFMKEFSYCSAKWLLCLFKYAYMHFPKA